MGFAVGNPLRLHQGLSLSRGFLEQGADVQGRRICGVHEGERYQLRTGAHAASTLAGKRKLTSSSDRSFRTLLSSLRRTKR